MNFSGFVGGSVVKNPPACRRQGFNPWVGKTPGGGSGNPFQYFLPGKPHGERSLAGDSLWGHKRAGHNLAI